MKKKNDPGKGDKKAERARHDRFMQGGNHAPDIPKAQRLRLQADERLGQAFAVALASGHGISYTEFLKMTPHDAGVCIKAINKFNKRK